MITVIACIIGAMALGCLGVACYAGWAAGREIEEGERIAERMSRYDYRSDTWRLP